MTEFDEAMSMLNAIKESPALKYNPEYRNACQLGIEALERIQGLRNFTMFQFSTPLPSESVSK